MNHLDFAQHHHWGIIEHGVYTLIDERHIAVNEWQQSQPEDILEQCLSLDFINSWLDKHGGLELILLAMPVFYFYQIQIRAYHTDPRQLTWIQLARK